MKEKFTFFWKKNSPFSNWYMKDFTINNTTYNCIEQYMMSEKVKLFEGKDSKLYSDIMNSTDQAFMKSCGRKVKNFDNQTWLENRERIVYEGLKAKFTQNMALQRILLASEGTLVEASPYDTIWGIGLNADDSRASKRETWLGDNLLGELLTKLKDELLEDELELLLKKQKGINNENYISKK